MTNFFIFSPFNCEPNCSNQFEAGYKSNESKERSREADETFLKYQNFHSLSSLYKNKSGNFGHYESKITQLHLYFSNNCI